MKRLIASLLAAALLIAYQPLPSAGVDTEAEAQRLTRGGVWAASVFVREKLEAKDSMTEPPPPPPEHHSMPKARLNRFEEELEEGPVKARAFGRRHEHFWPADKDPGKEDLL